MNLGRFFTCVDCGYQAVTLRDLWRHDKDEHPARRGPSVPLILRAKLDKPSCRNCGKQLTDEGNDSLCFVCLDKNQKS